MEINEVLVNSIMLLIPASDFDKESVAGILLRLKDFGYEATEKDVFLIAFSIRNVEREIKNKCNLSTLQKDLLDIGVNRVCGEVLFSLKAANQLNITFELEGALEQVQLGDVSVSFNDSTKSNEQRLDNLILDLRVTGENEFSCYRKIKWN